MIYYIIACIGGNELGPHSPLESGYIIFVMVAAAFSSAYIFGEMAVLVTIISKK